MTDEAATPITEKTDVIAPEFTFEGVAMVSNPRLEDADATLPSDSAKSYNPLECTIVLYRVPVDERLTCAGEIREAIVTRAWNDTCVNLRVRFSVHDLVSDHQVADYVADHLDEVGMRTRVLLDETGAGIGSFRSESLVFTADKTNPQGWRPVA